MESYNTTPGNLLELTWSSRKFLPRTTAGHPVTKLNSSPTAAGKLATLPAGTAVERRSLAGELSLSCARPVADG